jgi:hypothetical protein
VTPSAVVVACMFASIYLGGLWLCRHVSRGLDGHATSPARSAGPMGRRREAELGMGRTVVVVVVRVGG